MHFVCGVYARITTVPARELEPASGNNATLDSPGAASLNFTNTGSVAFDTMEAHTLTFQGSSKGNAFAPVIGDKSPGSRTGVVKAGTGEWTLSGTNAYTGATTVQGGTLVVNGPLTGRPCCGADAA